ncbi:MAG: hypothetical protein WCX95_04955 [Candidatus Gracilibacteria bacterium]
MKLETLDIVAYFLFAIYLLVLYIVAAKFAGFFLDPDGPKSYLFVGGLILYIVAIGGLLMTHSQNHRPLYELLIVSAVPILMYFGLNWGSGMTEFMTTRFYIFVGFAYFISICGGFILGILSAPIVYYFNGGKDASKIVNYGIHFVNNLGLISFGIVLFGLAILAIIFTTRELDLRLTNLTSIKKIILYILLTGETLFVAKMTYVNTIFAMIKK